MLINDKVNSIKSRERRLNEFILLLLIIIITIVICKNIGLAVNKEKTKCMEVGRNRSLMAHERIRIGSNSKKRVKNL